MSAIDNAFIRAYTLDTTTPLAPASCGYDETLTPESDARAVVAPKRAAAQSSAAATRTARRAVDPTNSTAVEQPSLVQSASSTRAVSKPANGLSPRRTPIVAAADKSPTMVAVSRSSRSAVPPPHFGLAAFVHTSTTLDPSPSIQNIAVLEPPSTAALAANTEKPDPVSQAEESPAIGIDREDSLSLEFTPVPLQLPSQMPPPLPLSAEISSKADLELEGPRAAFEVDHFSWPELCDALLEQRSTEFDHLVGQLVTESALGRKVVAITGSRRGDGRTTLALSLARRLAATAVKVVIVDADFEVPQLAARLGMTIQSGWENVLTDGLTVWDGLVESLNDRLALLPLAPRPTNSAGQPTPTEFVAKHADAIRQHLDALSKEFDVVLVDAGAVKAVRPDAKPRGPLALAGRLDAAIMVSDARTMAPGRTAELHCRLLDAKIVPLGIAENFCPRTPN